MPIFWKDKNGKEWVSHRGLVLERKVRCERVMSDIYSDETYAVVHDPETGGTKDIHTGSCFELFQGPWGRVVPDAEELLAKLRKENEERSRAARERFEAERVEKGKTLCVVKGRKVPLGTTGECIWYGPSRYDRGGRVGIKDETGNVHWTSARNVEVVLEAA